MKCTMKKIAGVIALTAMLSTVALPVFAAESATGGINVTYKANSATTDKADWLVSYRKQLRYPTIMTPLQMVYHWILSC